MSRWTAAFDTSGSLGTVAVARDGEVRSQRFLLTRGEHGSHLVPTLEDALAEAHAVPAELDQVVVGAGPGSFTGIRVAAATARGLVRGTGAHLHAFSSLAAAAVSEGCRLPPSDQIPEAYRQTWVGPERTRDGPEATRYVLFDARADRLYGAAYRLREGRLDEVRAPAPTTLGEVLASPLEEDAVYCGDGALRHREALEEAGMRVAPPPLGVPTAEGLLRLLALVPDPRPVAEPGRWTPDYLRSVGARPVLAPEGWG